jgi:DNA-binding HxlR family transcriptional regulator
MAKLTIPCNEQHDEQSCAASVAAVKDALYALSGKWKLPLIIALQEGPKRFNEIQRTLGEITPKILAKELREMELNQFIVRKVDTGSPVVVTYELTPYSASLKNVLNELRDWGMKHREKIKATLRAV